MTVEVEVDLKEFDKRMKQLEQNMKDAEVAFEDFAERVVAAAKQMAPVRSGRLRSSIDYKMLPDGVEIFVDVEYATFVEFGTINQAAQPFFYTAVESNKNYLIRRIEEELSK